MNTTLLPLDRLLGEAACIRLSVDFASHIDAKRYAPLVELFAPDGVLDRMGNVSAGHAEISRFLEARDPSVATRHICSNFSIDFNSTDAATGLCYVLFFQGKSAVQGEPATQTAAPAVVEYFDKFERGALGWRIKERRIRMGMRT